MGQTIPVPEVRWHGPEPARDDPGWSSWWEQAFVDAVVGELAFSSSDHRDGQLVQQWESNVERIRDQLGCQLLEMDLRGDHPATQLVMEFRREDARRDFGVFVNLWEAFREEGDQMHPEFAATLFLVWAEEPGGLVHEGIGMAWLNEDGEPVEWMQDQGSLRFRSPPPVD